MINKVTLVGNLGADPEVRRLENGTPVARFNVATNENYKDNDGNWQTQTEWHTVTAWRTYAEQAEKTLRKGSLVYIEGKISYRKYTDKNGIERVATEILPSVMRSLEKREGSGGGLRESSFPQQEPPVATRTTQVPDMHTSAPTITDAPVASDDLPF